VVSEHGEDEDISVLILRGLLRRGGFHMLNKTGYGDKNQGRRRTKYRQNPLDERDESFPSSCDAQATPQVRQNPKNRTAGETIQEAKRQPHLERCPKGKSRGKRKTSPEWHGRSKRDKIKQKKNPGEIVKERDATPKAKQPKVEGGWW